MKIQYYSMIDEKVKAQLRLLEFTGDMKRHKWLPLLILTPIEFAVLYLLIPGVTEVRLALTGGAVGMFVVVHLLIWRGQLTRRIRKMLVKQLGAEDYMHAEYEFTEDALIFRQMGQEVHLAWDSVREIRDRPDSIEIIAVPAGLALIPKRIFQQESEWREWLDFARSHAVNAQPGRT